MPLLKISAAIALIALGPILFGIVSPSAGNLTLYGLGCEFAAWTALVIEIFKIDRLFHRGEFLQRLLGTDTWTQETPETKVSVELPPFFGMSRLRVSHSGEFGDKLEREIKALEKRVSDLLGQLHKAHAKALQDVDAHLTNRVRQVENNLRESVTGDLGWAYFFALLAAGGLVLSTIPERIVVWLGP